VLRGGRVLALDAVVRDASLPPSTTTELYFTSFVLQNSASLRFFGTFISGALPEKLTTPLMVAVPRGPAFVLTTGGVAAAEVGALTTGAAEVAPTGFGGVGFGSSGQPTPTVRASVDRATSEARSRRCMRESSVPDYG
jgi:hypothetical protein